MPPGPAPAKPAILFTDVTAISGLQFDIERGATGEHFMVETTLGGLAWIDHDGDGDLDLYVANGHEDPANPAAEGRASDRLFANQGGGRFSDATVAAGIDERRYSQGVAVGDHDGDGDSDVLVTNFGRNTLLANEGGRFTDVTERSGLGGMGYHTGAAWIDYDRDGDLDLYIARYLEYDPATSKPCFSGKLRVYCHPNLFAGQDDLFYENTGDGTFREVGEQVGIRGSGLVAGKGFGVLAADLNSDGWVDLYVANDTTPNFLFHNTGQGTFVEQAAALGVAVDPAGRPLAGMGIAHGDVNEDGHLDLLVTNFAKEMNQLLLAHPGGGFDDAAARLGLQSSFTPLGFGTALGDFDCDSHLDLVVVNGHIQDRIEEYSTGAGALYAQEISLWRGTGSRFDPTDAGAALAVRHVGRGLAMADYDDDGDLDLAMVTHDHGLVLLRNDSSRAAHHYLTLRLRGRSEGSRVVVRTGERVRAFAATTSGSYLSGSDPRVHVGLGTLSQVDQLTVYWPDGTVLELHDIPADQLLSLPE